MTFSTSIQFDIGTQLLEIDGGGLERLDVTLRADEARHDQRHEADIGATIDRKVALTEDTAHEMNDLGLAGAVMLQGLGGVDVGHEVHVVSQVELDPAVDDGHVDVKAIELLSTG